MANVEAAHVPSLTRWIVLTEAERKAAEKAAQRDAMKAALAQVRGVAWY